MHIEVVLVLVLLVVALTTYLHSSQLLETAAGRRSFMSDPRPISSDTGTGSQRDHTPVGEETITRVVRLTCSPQTAQHKGLPGCDGAVREELIAKAEGEGWMLSIVGNIGLEPSAIAYIAKKNNGTFFKDMCFSRLRGFDKHVDYLVNKLQAGSYYLIGRANAARYRKNQMDALQFTPKDYRCSAVLRKTCAKEGVLEMSRTCDDVLEVFQRPLANETVKYYLVDTYALYYISEDASDSATSNEARKRLSREKREKRQIEHRARQVAKREKSAVPSNTLVGIRKIPKNRGVKRQRPNKCASTVKE